MPSTSTAALLALLLAGCDAEPTEDTEAGFFDGPLPPSGWTDGFWRMVIARDGHAEMVDKGCMNEAVFDGPVSAVDGVYTWEGYMSPGWKYKTEVAATASGTTSPQRITMHFEVGGYPKASEDIVYERDDTITVSTVCD